jgi:hypothetical protein
MARKSQSKPLFWETRPSATLSTFPTWNSKPGLHGDSPTTKSLGHDTAFMVRLSATCVCTWISKTFCWLVGKSNTTEQISPWDAKRGTTSQKKSLSFTESGISILYLQVSILSQTNLVHINTPYVCKINLIIVTCMPMLYHKIFLPKGCTHFSFFPACYAPHPSHPLIS